MSPYKHKVQYYETDRMQITHHSNYIRFMEEARIDFLEQIGWGYDKLEREGIVSPVVQVCCDYKSPTTYPDVISIEVHVLECTGVRLQLGYTLSVEGKVVCTGTSTHCFMDTKKQGRPLCYGKRFPAFYQILSTLQQEYAQSTGSSAQ